MTVGENSSVFGPRSLLMNWKRFNASFLTWFSSDTAEAMVFQMHCPLAQENFFLAAVDVGILHATMKNQVKICCKLAHFQGGPLFIAFPLKCMSFWCISMPYFFLKIKLLRTCYISFCRVTFLLFNYCKKAVPCVSYKETNNCRSSIHVEFFSESTTEYVGQKQFGTW